MMKHLAWLLALALSATAAAAQPAQIGSGQVWGNASAAQRNGKSETVTAIIDRALGSTRGAILERGASGWNILTPGTSGLPIVSAGTGADPAYAILGLSGGGSGANLTASNGGIVYSGASALAILSGTATAGQMLRSGSSAAPSWSTATWPSTVAQGDLLYGSASNVITALGKSTTATRYLANTGASNAPQWDQINLANGVTGTLPVANGGTNCGAASGTCLDNITGFASTGIISRTGAGTFTFSTISALIDAIGSTRGSLLYRGASGWAILAPGTANFILQTNGAGADPSWVAASAGGTVTTITAGMGLLFSSGATCTSTCTISIPVFGYSHFGGV